MRTDIRLVLDLRTYAGQQPEHAPVDGLSFAKGRCHLAQGKGLPNLPRYACAGRAIPLPCPLPPCSRRRAGFANSKLQPN